MILFLFTGVPAGWPPSVLG